jgi:protein-arginine kinase activator protein McsA
MTDARTVAEKIIEQLPILTVPCSHCPKVSEHVLDIVNAANRSVEVITTALLQHEREVWLEAAAAAEGNVCTGVSRCFHPGCKTGREIATALRARGGVVGCPDCERLA